MTINQASTSLVHGRWDVDPDERFGRPFVDVDEWRAVPVRHRYVHGGFADATRFSFYFPDADEYEGRFFQHVTPVPQSEHLAETATGEADKIAFSVTSGAYFVETNGGGLEAADPFSGLDPTIGAYRANAAAARFSRVVAAAIYGPHRVYGYLYGGSGGGYRTIGAAENTDGVWDGFVPYVIGSPMSIPNVFSVRMHAQRLLRHRFDAIVDAYDAGGDPASLELSDEERSALDEVTRMGFPPRSWFGWRTMGMHAFGVLYPGIMAADPGYADEFWSTDGYLGADPASSVHRDRVRLHTRVRDIFTAAAVEPDDRTAGGVDESYEHARTTGSRVTGFRLADRPAGWALGAELHVRSGSVAGAVIRIVAVEGDVVQIEPGENPAVVDAVLAGDEVLLDNSNFLAAQTYHRHQVPPVGYPVWDQFRAPDGTPLLPQRPMLLGPMFTSHTAGTVPAGRTRARMIVVACLLDREAFPWQADWYRQQVADHLGGSDDRLRLWYVDNALHGDDEVQEHPTRTVSYLGALHAALRQLARWVERGIEPARSTEYDVVDGQVVTPASAIERAGVQPTLTVTVDGDASVSVRVGEPVVIQVDATAAAGDGGITAFAIDLGGTGVLGPGPRYDGVPVATWTGTTVFDAPGTYFVAVRVTAATSDRADDPFGRVHNIARARVVVGSAE